MTGSFIVLEGPDASGTTRQSEFLAERMRKEGYDVVHTSEPTEGPVGKQIRSILQAKSLPAADALQLLFTADRAEHVQACIEPALRAGKVVISDRYTLSTRIYGSALGLSAQWLQDINRLFPVPDLTLITLPPFEVCMERLAKREQRDQLEGTTFQRTVYEAYQKVEDPTTIFVDTSAEKMLVAEGIWKQVERHFGPISRHSIAKL